ncbi:MAG: hypothetical protein R2873_34580 [Caldilineaceae bacterium]
MTPIATNTQGCVMNVLWGPSIPLKAQEQAHHHRRQERIGGKLRQRRHPQSRRSIRQTWLVSFRQW